MTIDYLLLFFLVFHMYNSYNFLLLHQLVMPIDYLLQILVHHYYIHIHNLIHNYFFLLYDIHTLNVYP